MFIGKLKSKAEAVDDISVYQSGLLKTFSFTSVGGGSGSSTLLMYIAQYLAKDMDKQVVILDLNFLQPDILYNMKVDVLAEKSILNYLKGSVKLEDCYLYDESLKNLKLVTASPRDDVELIMNLKTDSNTIGSLIEKLGAFDYVLINLPYIKPFVTFIETALCVDRGYLVLDDRLSGIPKAQELVQFTHSYLNRGNTFGNIILNKRSAHAYPYDKFGDSMSLVAEIPYDERVVQASNSRALLVDQGFSKKWFEGVSDIVEDILK